ncbi:hypothetical protein LX32DRAFT_638198 [Colletotrichum zoysiae]|uniref:Uncharacterized protein n=1 Tax=Colletotrichum zoysiae TaxID=1216348 RepID=A0AAD9HJK3_9PEZI|nr:hypothetical protein LX32DRAFT_638198 [Colletotrichum zoysiae]
MRKSVVQNYSIGPATFGYPPQHNPSDQHGCNAERPRPGECFAPPSPPLSFECLV